MKALLKKFEGKRILVIGDLMLDQYTWGDARRISPEAPVPVVNVSQESHVAGGAANVALNLKSLGAEVEVCGWIGRDMAGSQLVELLVSAGIVLNPRFHEEGRTTILKTRVMVRNQQLCRLDREGSPDEYAFATDVIEAIIQRAESFDAVILSDYGKGALSGQLVDALADARREGSPILAMDPKPRRKIAHRNLDLLTPNRSEALQMAGLEPVPGEPFPAEEVCRRIHEEFRPKYLVVTLGAEGMLVGCDGEVALTIPTMAREVFDVSGAGDTVVAALTMGLVTGVSIDKAARFANLAAGIVVGKVGTAPVQTRELLELREEL
ncbi:MAG: hypothetical protein CMI18_14065 [Opitutaceae bacterium]|nr:hypothetical protein [Opitutaceae bacterium]